MQGVRELQEMDSPQGRLIIEDGGICVQHGTIIRDRNAQIVNEQCNHATNSDLALGALLDLQTSTHKQIDPIWGPLVIIKKRPKAGQFALRNSSGLALTKYVHSEKPENVP